MVCAINLNNQPFVWCKEINNEITDNVLSQNLHPQCIVPYVLPQHLFCHRCILSVLSGKSPE